MPSFYYVCVLILLFFPFFSFFFSFFFLLFFWLPQAEVDKLLSKYKNAKKFVDLCRLLHDKYKEHPAEFAPPATKTGGDTKTDL